MKLPEEVSREQGEKLERIEEELEDVKRRLGRIWNAIETTDIEMADAPDRITERKKKTSELTQNRAVAEVIEIKSSGTVTVYSIPTPEHSPLEEQLSLSRLERRSSQT